jgi:hypothetical protein
MGKGINKRVRHNFDAEALKRICEADASTGFTEYATKVQLEPTKSGRERFYHFRDNGSKILFVAHLDTVCQDRRCAVVEAPNGLLALSGALDDRLGAYIGLDLLPRMGITCDWLLTTDEEICQTTAEDFTSEKQYNWLISMDRGGTDVVMYDYETKKLKALVMKAGANVGMGSFSDIAALEHLRCAGFNWGVGYQDYHSSRGYAWLDDTFAMVTKFIRFYEANARRHFEHEPWQSYRYTESNKRIGRTSEIMYGYEYEYETGAPKKGAWHDHLDDRDLCAKCYWPLQHGDQINGVCRDCLEDAEAGVSIHDLTEEAYQTLMAARDGVTLESPLTQFFEMARQEKEAHAE